jgi:hypothetical protein
MLRLPAHARINPRAAAFDYQAEKRALEALMQRLIRSIAETAPAASANPYDFLPRLEYPPLPPFQWRDANWALICGILFGLLFWWAFFTSAFPAFIAALNFLFQRTAA